MQEQKLYSRAPITEALIELQVEPSTTLAILADIQSHLEGDYPTRQDFSLLQGQMVAGSEVSSTPIGYRFLSADQKQIVLARLDSFTFSRLSPYDCWGSFRKETQRLWEVYQSLTNPKAITRLAVRYVNQLDLPLPLEDFKEYLQTVPEVSPTLFPQGLSGYFMQLQVPQENPGGMLILNEAIVPPSNPDVVSVLLDIELSQMGNLRNNEVEIWDCLEKLRTRKNQVFESCITDKTRELIR
jgi:uncharacterized protein (TIGR04255 family)